MSILPIFAIPPAIRVVTDKVEATTLIAIFTMIENKKNVKNWFPFLALNSFILSNAKKSLETAYSINPIDEDVIETYATICLSLKQFDETRFLCEEGLDLNPLNTHLWNLLGVSYFQTEEYEEAQAYFEQAVYINPYYVDALFNLRDTYDELGNRSGKIECDKKLAELGEKWIKKRKWF